MDRRERYIDPEQSLKMAIDGERADLWTALPGIVQSFDAVAMTCTVQPSISGFVRQPDNTYKPLNLPPLLDCPVFFPSGGGCTLTFPVKSGDECLVIFASRCIDSWWQLGGVQGQSEFRMHDLSDGFVLPGVRSQPRVLSGVSTSTTQLRSDDGVAAVELDPVAHTVNMRTTSASVEVSPSRVDITGVLWINGAQYLAHEHSGVQTGGGNSGGVV